MVIALQTPGDWHSLKEEPAVSELTESSGDAFFSSPVFSLEKSGPCHWSLETLY